MAGLDMIAARYMIQQLTVEKCYQMIEEAHPLASGKWGLVWMIPPEKFDFEFPTEFHLIILN